MTPLDIVVPAMTFMMFVAVGLDLTVEDFIRVRQQPLVVITGLLTPPVLLPAIAVPIITLVDAPPELAAGLLLVSVCPIGGISNVFSYLARASPALSVTLTGMSCLGAIVTIPLASRGLELLLDETLAFSAPTPVLVQQLVALLAVPVAIGMWIRHRWPAFASRYRPTVQRVAFGGVGVLVTFVVIDDPGGVGREWRTTIPVAALFVVCSFLAGWVVASLIGSDARDRFTIAAEFGTRNFGVAIAIAVTLLGRVEFARFAVMYFVTEVPLLLLAATTFRRTQSAGADPVSSPAFRRP